MPDATKYVPSDEEREAHVEKLRAEAAKLLEEARAAKAKADVAELSAEEERERRERDGASDYHARVYRFTTSFDDSSCNDAILQLNEWARLDADDPGTITLVINSKGGSVFPGLALYDRLRALSNDGFKIVTKAEGMAASMGGILLQAGDERWISREAWVLIHQVSAGALGSTYEMADKVEHLKRIQSRVIDMFVNRSDGKLDRETIENNWERKDWWLDSDECLELGVVDKVVG